MPTAVLVLSAIDPTLRDAATGALVCDLPDCVALRYDVDHARHGLRRVLSTTAAVLETGHRGLGACPTCAVREDALSTATGLAASGARHLIVALPATMTPMPLALGVQYSQAPITLAAAVAVFDATRLAVDLLGPDLLVDRGLNLGRDPRTVGEALNRQVETADLLLSVGDLDPAATALLDHLAGPIPTRCDLYTLDPVAALRGRRPAGLSTRGDLRLAAPTGAPDRDGVWTLDLSSTVPLHPQRLLQQLAELSTGRIRGRGYFWLPTAPEVQYGWDNAGGRLLLDVLDHWPGPPHTRLVITGNDDSAPRLRAAFDTALVTADELAADRWAQLPEGLLRRLGTRRYRCATSLPDEPH